MSSSTKNYKFSIGSIFFLLAAIAMPLFYVLEGIKDLLFKLYNSLIMLFQYGDITAFVNILLSGNENIFNMLYVWGAALALVVAGIMLIIKLRGIALACPFAVFCVACLCGVIGRLVQIIGPLLGLMAGSALIPSYFIDIVSFFVLMVATIALIALILVNKNGTTPNALSTILKWAAPALAFIGSLGLTVSAGLSIFLKLISSVVGYFNILSIVKQLLSLDFIGALVTMVLLTAGFLFTALWIANPYKKN